MYFPVLNVLEYICTIVLSCNSVILVLYLTLPLKHEVWIAAKPGSTHQFLKCPVPSQENGSCYLIVRFCVCCILVFLFCRCSPLIFDVFPQVLVCNPDLFFSQSIYIFEQRYTSGAFIYYFYKMPTNTLLIPANTPPKCKCQKIKLTKKKSFF